jgi:hypothetical protein
MWRVRDRRGAYRVLVGHLVERDLMEDLGVDGMLILKWILKSWVGETRTGLMWLSEPSVSVKYEEFLD